MIVICLVGYHWVSDGEIDDPFVLVALDEVVDEVSVEDGLEESGHKGDPDEVLPVVDPECCYRYQCRM